jgi:ABC-type lipoprotein release transport system permease subunit
MKLYLTLAWRNIWRNKRRSLISMSSVVFAVVIAVATRSMQLGFYSHTIHNVVSFETGYLQVHADGYQESQRLDDCFVRPDSVAAIVAGTPHVTAAAPRLESFALLSGGSVTDGAQIIGIDPAREDRVTGLRRRLASGRFLAGDDRGILLGAGLAEHLQVGPGDTVIALGSGYHAASAAGGFVVRGTVRFPIPELNTTIAYLSLPAAQELLAAPDRATSLVVMLDDPRALPEAAARLRTRLGPAYEVISWQTMMPEMVQYIGLDNASGILMLALVYVVIGFGILGTVLMMTLERTREFGVLVAVGMRRRMLGGIVLLESVILAIQGALVGTAIGVPLLMYLVHHPVLLGGEVARAMRSYGFEPIVPFALRGSIFASQTLAMLAIALAAAVLPLLRIHRLDPVAAMSKGL